MAATWSYGRRLTGLSSGSEAFSYSYNADGIRTAKTVNGVKHTYALSGTTILNEEWTENGVQHLLMYVYDANGSPVGMVYRNSTMAADATEEYLFVKNIQGDILYVYSSTGNKLVSYVYDAWGNIISTTYSNGGGTSAARFNPFTYRGYYRDSETGMYYLNSRYYNPKMGRFINADNQLSGGDLLGYNLYAYCGNNPVSRVDPTGEAWWHWALAATVVVACAVATVVTCGGFAAAATAVGLVAGGTAAGSAAMTITASAFIGSATALGVAALSSASTSSSVKDFNDKGNWGTVAMAAGGAVIGGTSGYLISKGSGLTSSTSNPKVTSSVENDIIDLPRTNSALKIDPYHNFPDIVDNYAGYATQSPISNGTLYQLQGSLNGVIGRFEWIIQDQQVTHRLFVEGGGINGIPIIP